MKYLEMFAPLALLVTFAASEASAQEEPICELKHTLDKYKTLRRLSLDLRDRIPSYEEYRALDEHDQVPASMIEVMLDSDEFRLAMRRYHADIFWPNLSDIELDVSGWRIRGTPTATDVFDASANTRREIYRGSYAYCGDFEHTSFDPAFPGDFRPLGAEGWRWVTPYWDPDTPIKVCARVAQETEAVDGVTCQSSAGFDEPACGCGANLRYCHAEGKKTNRLLMDAFIEQLNRAVDHVTVDGAPYTDLITSSAADENALIATFMRNAARPTYGLTSYHDTAPNEAHADIDFDHEGWVAVDRGSPHAGVLTLPAFLLRFPTNRGRLNRFRTNFTCEAFIPPAELVAQPGCSETTDDLTERCHCQYCHTTIEPEAAHFGVFTETGFTQMSDESVFPRFDPSCVDPRYDQTHCRRFYVTRNEEHAAGTLAPWQWAGTHQAIADNLAAGPTALAQRSVDDGSFGRCAVQRAFGRLIKRDMRTEGEDTTELSTLETLTADFRQSGYDYRQLIAEIVSLPQYREVQ